MKRKSINKHLLSAAVIFLLVSPIIAQKDQKPVERKEAEELIKQIISLYKSGKYDEALPLAEKAVILSENATGSTGDLTVASLRNLAEIQVAKRKNQDAEATYDRYLTVYEKVVGENDPKFISSLDRYVCLLIDTNKRSKAVDIQKRIYKLDNKFDFDDKEKTPQKNLEGGGILVGKIDNIPRPTYLAEAKIARITGSVVYKVNLDETGKVLSAKTLCGNPLLIQGSQNSILQARYKPTIVSGKPVKVTGVAIINFIL